MHFKRFDLEPRSLKEVTALHCLYTCMQDTFARATIGYLVYNLYTRYPTVARALVLAAECVARTKVTCIQLHCVQFGERAFCGDIIRALLNLGQFILTSVL